MILAYDPNEEQSIDWNSPLWGKPGHNVHGLVSVKRDPSLADSRVTVSKSGSWLESEREDR